LQERNLGSIANTSNNVFTLGIHQVIAKHDIFAGLRVAVKATPVPESAAMLPNTIV
jgi:hypothetical protein